MYEIELKAWAKNTEKITKKLNEFAHFVGTVDKHDVYWQLNDSVKIRIRHEQVFQDKNKYSTIFVTYKKKEILHNQNQVPTTQKCDHSACRPSFEVNEENEFIISDLQPFEKILVDSGFSVGLKKHKEVRQWKYENVLIELCHIESLGDFIEIEILSQNSNSEDISLLHKKLLTVLSMCDVPESDIENRYYSEMLLVL